MVVPMTGYSQVPARAHTAQEVKRSGARGVGDEQPALHLPADPHAVTALELAGVDLARLADRHPLPPRQGKLVLDIRTEVQHLVDGRVGRIEAVRSSAVTEDAHPFRPYGGGAGRSRCHLGPSGRRRADAPSRLVADHPAPGAAVDVVPTAEDVRLPDEVPHEQ